jgi:enolase-phosphatase E1
LLRAIITDIEGTTSSLSFVKDVLFPYARQRLPDFVRTHYSDSKVMAILKEANTVAGGDLTIEGLIAQLVQWIDEDRKVTSLKTLQGLIWEAGYKNGDFRGHIYPDVEGYLKHWKAQGMDLYVYSSGSVQAQWLLFAHTQYGDLTPLFSGYFDTSIGHKRDPASYVTIAHTINLPPPAILFLSDILEELDAAHTAGMQTVWLKRDGVLDPTAAHRQVKDFEAVFP